uniref:Uncharacterized protein n=1 Tax=Arundo donax TaxID=35708 RepID=A0A0A9HPC1_ARUDO
MEMRHLDSVGIYAGSLLSLQEESLSYLLIMCNPLRRNHSPTF